MSRLRAPSHRRKNSMIDRRHRQAGLSLPETLLSITLCMPLILGAIHLLCQSVGEQSLSHQTLLMEQDAQFALNIINDVVQLAGHQDPLIAAGPLAQPRLQGLDDATLAARTDIGAGRSGPGASGSDVLMVRFSGSSASGHSPLNCAGMPVPSGTANADDPVADAQGYSVFYVARGPDGENELRCKYRAASGWDSEALVQGVESFQVLYGLDRNDDGLPDQFLNASAITDEIGRTGSDTSLWNRVVAVKVALLMRSTRRVTLSSKAMQWDLFGDEYSVRHATSDRGTRLSPENFTADQRHRIRRAYEQLIFIRNPSRAAAAE